MRVLSYYWPHPRGMPTIDKTEQSKDGSKEERRRFYVTDKGGKTMKNSNLFKKFAAIVVSAMMVLTTFAMPTFAADKDSQITISGVEANATVTAYQVVKYDNGEWKLVDDSKSVTFTGTGAAKTAAPTADEVIAIASNPGTLPATELDPVGDKYQSETNELAPGMYVVVVTDTSSGTVYNPMVVSIDFAEGNNTNSVSAADKFTGNAYAKSSTPTLEKTTQDNQDRYNEAPNPFVGNTPNDPAKDRNVGTDRAGSVIPYKVVTTIPSYSGLYENPQFIFTDALQKGFAGYETKPVVYEQVGDEAITLVEGTDYWFVKSTSTEVEQASGEKIKVRDKEGNDYTNVGQKSFSIAFKVETGKIARKICITYSAKLVGTDHADYTSGLDPNTNEAKIEWTKDASDEDDFSEGEDCTHHYTFNIDGNIGGNEVGKEIIKVATDENGKIVVSEKELEKNWTALDGAKFAIYKTNADFTEVGDLVQEVTTTDGGQMKFRGLDAGKYVIMETEAPTGYARLNELKIPVEITPTFETVSHHGKDCEILKSYTIKINDEYTNTYTVNQGTVTKASNSDSIEANDQRTDAVQDIPGFTAGVVNSQVGTLPSTGGMGTVIFTVGGIAIMALALFLLFGAKKKEQE